MYDKGQHLDWWQSLPATERFPLMKKYDIKQVNNKLIYRMWNGEFPPAKCEQALVSSSLPDPDFEDDEDDFQCCDNCDLPDACADFGCAIKQGIRINDDGIF